MSEDKASEQAGVRLWTHPSPESTPMWHFMQEINKNHNLNMKTYNDFHQWSVENISKFWGEVWRHTDIVAQTPYKTVVDETAPMYPRPAWFEGATLNFAENLLLSKSTVGRDDATAIIAATESGRESVTWAELRERVRQCQGGMERVGIKEGDRIAGYVANHINAIVAMLAATSLGAIWTAISPDTGVQAVLDRMRQIEPALLFTDNASMYNGKTHPIQHKVEEIVASLPSLRGLIIFNTVPSHTIDHAKLKLQNGQVYNYATFVQSVPDDHHLHFLALPPDHPVYILYSSGTTGAPKPIVHGCIGTLLQHKKEHQIHCSISSQSRFFYFTTCTWMMWHWLVSGLASGATLVLYDGSPFRYRSTTDPSGSVLDDAAMPRLIDELGITHFGTSAKYLSLLEQKDLLPRSSSGLSLKTLQAIYSTGSPLAPSTFHYTYRAFGSQINLGSITGGTDIVSLFGAPNPLVPVFAGEIQSLGLGMAVRAWDYKGTDVTSSGEPGDLVCVKAFPCQPVSFWGSNGAARYKSSYFETFPGVWHHGDFIRFNPATGGLYMLGRSDGILKPSGVRFGSAEIYNVLLDRFPGVIEDALCIGRRREKDSDETVVLFLKMEPGQELTQERVKEIKTSIRSALSARHVPGIIDTCPEIPVTTNGKKVEVAVKQILSGTDIKVSASVANAGCLEWYREWAVGHTD